MDFSTHHGESQEPIAPIDGEISDFSSNPTTGNASDVSPRLAAALEYAERGIKIFPCRPGAKFPCEKGFFEAATTDPDVIRGWFDRCGDVNIAYCPEDNGYCVADIDVKDGKPGLDNWRTLPFDKPMTATVATPTGGLHYHYRGSLRTTVGKLDKNGKLQGIAAGIDTRGIRSLALLPPSQTPDGEYSWLIPLEYAVPVPAGLVELAKPRERTRLEAPEGFELDAPWNVDLARQELHGLVRRGYVAAPGDRDDTTFKVVCKILELGISPPLTAELMHEIWEPACEDLCGEDPDLIENKIDSALRGGMQNAIGAKAYPDPATYLEGLPPQNPTEPNASVYSVAAETAATPTVRIISGADRKAVKVEWLWRGYLAMGKFHILGGQKGAGKSTLTFDLFAQITTGGKWPDGTQAPLGDVLIWSAENDFDDTILPRFLAAGGDRNRLRFVDKVDIGDGKVRHFDPATDVEKLLAAARKLPNLKAVMIDPVVSAVAGDSHKNAETRRGLQPLVDFAAERRIALLGITHFTKNTQGNEPIERITGSLAFTALPRVVLGAVKGESEDAPRRLVRIASNIGPAGGGFEYTLFQELLPGHDFSAQRVFWGKHLTGSAKELLEDAQAQPGEGVKAAEFLTRMLTDAGNSGMEVVELKKAAEAHSIAWRTVERAKQKLGCIRAKRRSGATSGGWYWVLETSAAGENSTVRREGWRC